MVDIERVEQMLEERGIEAFTPEIATEFMAAKHSLRIKCNDAGRYVHGYDYTVHQMDIEAFRTELLRYWRAYEALGMRASILREKGALDSSSIGAPENWSIYDGSEMDSGEIRHRMSEIMRIWDRTMDDLMDALEYCDKYERGECGYADEYGDHMIAPDTLIDVVYC